ncbi:MAG: phosphate transport system permease protein [Candidatus Tokpelaia sp. JSC161]|jgi:phosphate transport system permease protein|nr:MAG: phosphate transport system permease protein [Candidatus Tokpelaia sp. JSC161]
MSKLLKHRDIRLKQRYRAEAFFRSCGLFAISLGVFFLLVLLYSVFSQGVSAFWQTSLTLSVKLDAKIIDPEGRRANDPQIICIADYPRLLRNALAEELGVSLDDLVSLREVSRMFSFGAGSQLRDLVVKNPQLIGTSQKLTFLAASHVDSVFKGQVNLSVSETKRKLSNKQLEWMKKLAYEGILHKTFNFGFFIFSASSRPEMSGLGVALIGSFYMMFIVLLCSLPIGVAAAVYLEEYAGRNRFTDLIEVNINNLAAVPSIIFGLLGLVVFIHFLGLPRSSSLVGGLVLTLMTFPTIIIATRSALRAVSPSIRLAALGLGASKTQTVFQHVIPLAIPGILTGTILGLAHALGETAPLLLIGMVAFVANYPVSPMDPATAVPVQIYMWANEAERAFVERTFCAIIVLLMFLALMNIAAVLLRNRFERRF